jgi:hypothetical protein
MEVKEEVSTSFFTQSFHENYPPDWQLSPANNYQIPDMTSIDAIDSSLAIENERRLSLCLAPFSKEFYTITGYSKLNIPEDYHELIGVIIWHNRQRLKTGLLVLSPMELEEFLHQEMHQDFSDCLSYSSRKIKYPYAYTKIRYSPSTKITGNKYTKTFELPKKLDEEIYHCQRNSKLSSFHY